MNLGRHGAKLHGFLSFKADSYLYAADYAGNEMIKTYEILEDLEYKIIATYSVSDDYKTNHFHSSKG